MANWKIPAAFLVVAMAIGIALQILYWPQLPDRMATHFDPQGNPNDWMDRASAVGLCVGLIVFLPLFFIGISVAIRWLPVSTINLPHREYWLSAERRDESLRWMTGWMIWFSVAITIFLVAINHLIFVANRDARPLSAVWFWAFLSAFMLTTAALIVLVYRRFGRPK
ncbi:MAG: DUF1648 domain-containing protein [Planctomycetaceae bacterium]|nr:DUF1648 domain-containing protein [Planctomycetaceae bacterium]